MKTYTVALCPDTFELIITNSPEKYAHTKTVTAKNKKKARKAAKELMQHADKLRAEKQAEAERVRAEAEKQAEAERLAEEKRAEEKRRTIKEIRKERDSYEFASEFLVIERAEGSNLTWCSWNEDELQEMREIAALNNMSDKFEKMLSEARKRNEEIAIAEREFYQSEFEERKVKISCTQTFEVDVQQVWGENSQIWVNFECPEFSESIKIDILKEACVAIPRLRNVTYEEDKCNFFFYDENYCFDLPVTEKIFIEQCRKALSEKRFNFFARDMEIEAKKLNINPYTRKLKSVEIEQIIKSAVTTAKYRLTNQKTIAEKKDCEKKVLSQSYKAFPDGITPIHIKELYEAKPCNEIPKNAEMLPYYFDYKYETSEDYESFTGVVKSINDTNITYGRLFRSNGQLKYVNIEAPDGLINIRTLVEEVRENNYNLMKRKNKAVALIKILTEQF